MQDYIKNVTYVPQTLTKTDERTDAVFTKRLQIDPLHPSYKDHAEMFSQEHFKYPYMPLYLGQYNIDIEKINVNALRLIIRLNSETLNIALPEELLPLKDFVINNINYHRQYYPENKDCFIYITVRTTEKDCYYSNSQTWHIDGFQGSRIDRHLPEQDIIWSNVNPTEFLLQPFYVDGLNPGKHDINQYFQDNADNNRAMSGVENGVYLLTPYNIHRVSNKPFDQKRVFVRLTFSPVLIEDSTNTTSPIFGPKLFKQFNFKKRDDVRNHLWNYNTDETLNNGFKQI